MNEIKGKKKKRRFRRKILITISSVSHSWSLLLDFLLCRLPFAAYMCDCLSCVVC